MKRRGRRGVTEAGLSFLDVISCGFGAVILLLIITKTVEPTLIDRSTQDLQAMIATLQSDLFSQRDEVRELREQRNASRAELEETLAALSRVAASAESAQAQLAAERRVTTQLEEERERLAQARQTLSEETQRLIGSREAPNSLIGGIPVDSEYVIFVIDTSGSMFNVAWPKVLQKLEETLAIYPEVKGIQVMNDMGGYMFTNYAGQWIPDTPGRRRVIIERLRSWNPFSNSSPVEGINEAIRSFYQPDISVSVFVFGDDFTGDTIAGVLRTVDAINRASDLGERRVRIHCVGFPQLFTQPDNRQQSVTRFAHLMRELTWRNGGTFVGLPDFR